MSQYSQGYGQWPGDPSGYYPYPTNPPQTQQTQTPYQNPTEPVAPASYMASHNSFIHNSTQIPGLGFGGPSTSATNGPTPQPQQNGWPLPPPSFGNYGQQQVPSAPAAALQSTKPLSQPTTSPKRPTQTTQETMEEGELSDADFDDLYDPQLPDTANQQPIVTNKTTKPVEHTRPNSYSPHLSPNEVSQSAVRPIGINGSNPRSHNTINPSLPGLGLHTNQEIAETVLTQAPAASVQFKSVDEAKKEAQKAILRLLPLGVKYQTYIDEGFDKATVVSLFNELNLLPPSSSIKPAVQVPKPDKPTTEKAVAPEGSTPAAKDKTEERKDRIARLLAAKAANKTPVVSSKSSTTSPAPAPAESVPAAPQINPTTVSPSVAPTDLQIPNAPSAKQNLPPISAPTAPLALRKEKELAAKPKSKADKEALLKKKLEALKSRQAQAQLANTAASTPLPTTPAAADSRPSIPRPPSAPLAIASEPVPSIASHLQSSTLSTLGMNGQTGSSIPGLSLSTSNLGQVQSRKRPVAADFVEYSTTVGTPKRPFGQNRQDSFVIEISEESEDDDVEMEVDSPGGHSVTSSTRVDTPNRGPVVRDFPPLSDGTPRKSLTRNNSNVPPAKLNKLDSDILRMRAKIAAAEAKKRKAGSGSQTPDVFASTPELKEPAPAPEPAEQSRPVFAGQRAISSSDVESTDLPSAQLISEAASVNPPAQHQRSRHGYGQLGAALAPPPIHATTQASTADVDRRTRIASVHMPKVEARLLEKKTKLKLLEQKAAQLKREIEMEAAEREKLADELRELETEPIETVPDTENSVSQQPVDDAPGAPESKTSEEAGESCETSAQPQHAVPPAPEPVPQDSEPMQLDEDNSMVDEPVSAQESSESVSGPNLANFINNGTDGQKSPAAVANVSPPAKAAEPFVPASAKSPHVDVVMASTASTPESGQIDESTPSPSRASNSRSSPMDESHLTEKRPVLALDTISSGRAEGPSNMTAISDVVHAIDDTERTADINGEAPTDPTEDKFPSFTPYESPLSYFRSYRFHPKYAETVTGGLKSLTYTNKINPKQALCLNELTQKKCNDPACGFQHFKSMVPRDDQILMELGQADDFADGDEKSRYIAGLRDLLVECRTHKIRDMNEIGRAIIEYRRKFIGDQSRVLTSLQDTEI